MVHFFPVYLPQPGDPMSDTKICNVPIIEGDNRCFRKGNVGGGGIADFTTTEPIYVS